MTNEKKYGGPLVYKWGIPAAKAVAPEAAGIGIFCWIRGMAKSKIHKDLVNTLPDDIVGILQQKGAMPLIIGPAGGLKPLGEKLLRETLEDIAKAQIAAGLEKSPEEAARATVDQIFNFLAKTRGGKFTKPLKLPAGVKKTLEEALNVSLKKLSKLPAEKAAIGGATKVTEDVIKVVNGLIKSGNISVSDVLEWSKYSMRESAREYADALIYGKGLAPTIGKSWAERFLAAAPKDHTVGNYAHLYTRERYTRVYGLSDDIAKAIEKAFNTRTAASIQKYSPAKALWRGIKATWKKTPKWVKITALILGVAGVGWAVYKKRMAKEIRNQALDIIKKTKYKDIFVEFPSEKRNECLDRVVGRIKEQEDMFKAQLNEDQITKIIVKAIDEMGGEIKKEERMEKEKIAEEKKAVKWGEIKKVLPEEHKTVLDIIEKPENKGLNAVFKEFSNDERRKRLKECVDEIKALKKELDVLTEADKTTAIGKILVEEKEPEGKGGRKRRR